nr:hypothetical protein Iba_chr13bCG10200 [Ipomoea batatas]
MQRTTLRRELAPKARRGKKTEEKTEVLSGFSCRTERGVPPGHSATLHRSATALVGQRWRLEKRCYCRPATAVHGDEGTPLLHRRRRSPLLVAPPSIAHARYPRHCYSVLDGRKNREYVDCHCRSSSVVAAGQEAREGGGRWLLLADDFLVVGRKSSIVAGVDDRERDEGETGGGWWKGSEIEVGC